MQVKSKVKPAMLDKVFRGAYPALWFLFMIIYFASYAS